MKEVVAYVCDFCPKKHRYAAKGTALRHERICYWNPARRACVTCKHFSNEPYEPDTGAGGPGCELGLLRVGGEFGEPPQMFRANCEKWDSKNL